MLVYIAGKSASGKDTLAESLINDYNLIKIKRDTTRPKRIGESDEAYNFLTKAEYDSIRHCDNSKYTMADGNTVYYGLSTKEIDKAIDDKDNIYIAWGALDPLLKMPVFLGEKTKDIFVIYLDVDEEHQVVRYLPRCKKNKDYSEMCRRIHTETNDYPKFIDSVKKYYKIVSINTNIIDKTAVEFMAWDEINKAFENSINLETVLHSLFDDFEEIFGKYKVKLINQSDGNTFKITASISNECNVIVDEIVNISLTEAKKEDINEVVTSLVELVVNWIKVKCYKLNMPYAA